jgi:hypothetical protein
MVIIERNLTHGKKKKDGKILKIAVIKTSMKNLLKTLKN